MAKTREKVSQAENKAWLEAEVADLANQYELLSESLTDMVIQFEDVGWEKLDGSFDNGRGVTLEMLKRWSPVNQGLVTINPLAKRAIKIRISYVFGEGVDYKNAKAPRVKEFIKANADLVFSPQAYEEQETAAATEGNIFYLLDSKTKKVTRIPLREITNIACKPGSLEEKMFFQRTWVESTTDTTTAEPNQTMVTKRAWYPVPDLDRFDLLRTQVINGVAVDQAKAVLHLSFNKQIGWLYGVPHLQPVIFWIKAYKEYLEANYTLVRALARFTWKIAGNTATSTKRAAAKLAAAPTLNPVTGRPLTTGGAAVMGPGEDLTAVNKAGANVDFNAGRPLAAMIAAGMEVSLVHLLSDPSVGSANTAETLDTPTWKSTLLEQSIFQRGYEKIFEYFGFKDVEPVFPPVQSDALHRTVQAITVAASTNALFPEEIRQLLVLAFRGLGITAKDGLPENGQNAEFVSGLNPQKQADAALAASVNQNPGTPPLNTPKGSSKAKGRSPAGKTPGAAHDNRPSAKDSPPPGK